MGWGLSVLVRRVRSRPQAGSEQYPRIGNAEDNDEQHGKKDDFPAPWTVEQMPGGYKVLDASSNLSLTSMGARQKPMLIRLASSLLIRLGA
jgi:hypothetical protein